MSSDCTIFLDIDGILNYRKPVDKEDVYQSPVDLWDHYKWEYDRTPGLVRNMEALIALVQPRLVCCSSWRLGRTLAQLNGIMFQIFGDTDIHFDSKVRDLRGDEVWGDRGQLIQETRLAESNANNDLWLVIDDLTMPSIPKERQVQPRVGEGFSLVRLAEAFDKLAKQGGY